MALPTIKINNSTGSNTAASGAGPGDGTTGGSAVTGTAAAHTNGAASTTITLTNSPDLSTILTDGSHVLYLATSSGRKFSAITAVDNTAKTVTVEDSFTIALASAVDYAIGGKRLDFETTNSNTKQVFADAKAGWTIDIEQTGSDYVLTTTITVSVSGDQTSTGGYITIMSSSTIRPIITSATNSIHIFTVTGGFLKFDNLKITHTAATRGRGISHSTGTSQILVNNCIFDGCSSAVVATNSVSILFFLTQIKNSTGTGASFGTGGIAFSYCVVNNNNGVGITMPTNVASLQVYDSIIIKNSGNGIEVGSSSHNKSLVLGNTTIANNRDDGVRWRSSTGGNCRLYNNLIYDNGVYGMVFTALGSAGVNPFYQFIANNAYGANPSGNINVPSGIGYVDVLANPFVDSVNNNYALNSNPSGGILLKHYGLFSGVGEFVSTSGYNDIGALKHRDPFNNKGWNGGFNS